MIPISQIDWARLAAFIDGEGTIVIAKARSIYTQLTIRVVNTDPRLPLWCKSIFGGKVYAATYSKTNVKRAYVWTTQAKKAEEILRGCFPYFLIKREQAEVALAYRETFDHIKGNTPEQNLTADRQLVRAKFRTHLSRLKKEIPEHAFFGAPEPPSKETIQ